MHVVSDVHEDFPDIPLKMAPRKGFSTFSRVVSEGLSDQSYWYVLTTEICGIIPLQYLKRSPIVKTFPEDFCRVESGKLRLLDGRPFVNKKSSSAFEVVCSSFGLVSAILRKKTSSEERGSAAIYKVKEFLNGLDFSSLKGDGDEVNCERPRAARRLSMPPQFNTPKTKETPVPVHLTPPSSGSLSSPNLKEICERNDLETPEKTFLIKKRGSRVLQDVQGICERSRENLSTVLSSMCAFGDPEAKAIVNEIVEDVALKKGVKRTVEELVGDETFSLYVESLRVPDWVLLYFKTKARISGNTWQAVINITKLGRTGVRFILSNQCYKANVLPTLWRPLSQINNQPQGKFLTVTFALFKKPFFFFDKLSLFA